MNKKIELKNVLRYPQLDTVLMLEKAAKKSNDNLSLTQLWRSLPRKVMYQTYKVIIQYLIDSGKIIIHNKKVIWIYDPETIKRLHKEKLIIK